MLSCGIRSCLDWSKIPVRGLSFPTAINSTTSQNTAKKTSNLRRLKGVQFFFNLSSNDSLNYGNYHSDRVSCTSPVQNSEFQGRENDIQINIREATWNFVKPHIATVTEVPLNRLVQLESGLCLYLLQVWLPRYVWCPVPSSLPVPAGLISTTTHTQSHHSVSFGMRDAHSCRCCTRCDDSLPQQCYQNSDRFHTFTTTHYNIYFLKKLSSSSCFLHI